jgi:hypothetical protein
VVSDATVITIESLGNCLLPSHKVAENEIAVLYPEELLPREVGTAHPTPMEYALVKTPHTDLSVEVVWIDFDRTPMG